MTQMTHCGHIFSQPPQGLLIGLWLSQPLPAPRNALRASCALSDRFNAMMLGVVRQTHDHQPIRPAIRHCHHHEGSVVTNRSCLFRLDFTAQERCHHWFDLRTCFDFHTQRTTPDFFMSAVHTCDAQSLSCFACFAVTFASVAFAPATIADAATHMATIGDVSKEIAPTWAVTFAWVCFFCHVQQCPESHCPSLNC